MDGSLPGRASRRDTAVDVAFALALLLACLGWGLLVPTGPMYALVSVALVVPLVVRRRYPAVCLGVVVAVAAVQWVIAPGDLGSYPAQVAVPVAVHAAAAYGSRWTGRLALLAGLAGAVLGGVVWPRSGADTGEHLLVGGFLAAVVVAGWTAGELHRNRTLRTAALAERARLLEVERVQAERLAVLGERRRVARDMHDVVAHALAGVVALADGARYARSDADPALAEIADHARRALGETRRVIGVLRDDGDHHDAASAPHPGLLDLPDLVERARGTGLDAHLDLDPGLDDADPEIAVTVYRVVQEALTNVVRHAHATRVTVAVVHPPGAVRVEVRDDGSAALHDDGRGGYGLVGMRERVDAHDGRVDLTSLPGGGHLLRAEIPVAR